MHRRIVLITGLGIALTANVSAQAQGAVKSVSTSSAVKSPRTKSVRVKSATKSHVKSAAQTFSGQPVDTRWGPVQITIVVKAKKIIDVNAPMFPNERQRSAEINHRALPTYRKEVLVAQSANISGVSGASYTWDGYTTSLQQAIDNAHARGAL